MNDRRKFLGLSALLPFAFIKTGHNNEIQLGDRVRGFKGKTFNFIGQIVSIETAKYSLESFRFPSWDKQYPKWKDYPVYGVKFDKDTSGGCMIYNHFQIEKL